MTDPLDDPRRALEHKMAPVARQWRQLADDALAQFGVSGSESAVCNFFTAGIDTIAPLSTGTSSSILRPTK